MKVFVSWSGDMGRQLAEAVKDWLPCVLLGVKPYFTPSDIVKGARWSSDIAEQLETSKVGIFCITRENYLKPWIMFEAGALSKVRDTSRVCTILFNVETSILGEGPLSQFQATPFSRAEMLKLVQGLNAIDTDNSLPEDRVVKFFDKWWPDLEGKIQAILALEGTMSSTKPTARPDSEKVEEILELVRLLSVPLQPPVTNSAEFPNKDQFGALLFSFKAIFRVYATVKDLPNAAQILPQLRDVYRPVRYIMSNNSETRKPIPNMELERIMSELDSLFGL